MPNLRKSKLRQVGREERGGEGLKAGGVMTRDIVSPIALYTTLVCTHTVRFDHHLLLQVQYSSKNKLANSSA